MFFSEQKKKQHITVGSLLFYFRSLIIGLRYACFEVSHITLSIYCCSGPVRGVIDICAVYSLQVYSHNEHWSGKLLVGHHLALADLGA